MDWEPTVSDSPAVGTCVALACELVKLDEAVGTEDVSARELAWLAEWVKADWTLIPNPLKLCQVLFSLSPLGVLKFGEAIRASQCVLL